MNTSKITLELPEGSTLLTLREVAEQMEQYGGLHLEGDEAIGECRLEFGTDLEVDINKVIEGDPRCSGYLVRTDTITISDIRAHFTAADYYAWGKDGDGDDVLVCFGC